MKVSVLYFYSDESGTCKVQTQLIESGIAGFKNVELKRINTAEHKQLAEEYGVADVPTIIIECDGKERERFVGLTQEIFLKRAVEKALEG